MLINLTTDYKLQTNIYTPTSEWTKTLRFITPQLTSNINYNSNLPNYGSTFKLQNTTINFHCIRLTTELHLHEYNRELWHSNFGLNIYKSTWSLYLTTQRIPTYATVTSLTYHTLCKLHFILSIFVHTSTIITTFLTTKL